MNKDTSMKVTFGVWPWIMGLVIQGFTVIFLSRFLITLDYPVNIVWTFMLLVIFIAITVPTIGLIRSKIKSNSATIIIGAVNIIVTAMCISFFVWVAGLRDALLSRI